MRPKWVIANWKMHGDTAFVRRWADAFKPPAGLHCAVCPPAPYLSLARECLPADVLIGGQNVAAQIDDGAHTGEISARMLADAGCRLVLVGHSERRQWDDDEVCAEKCRAALAAGLHCVLCVGESELMRMAGSAVDTVLTQLGVALSGGQGDEWSRIIIAYEPIWAIGSGHTPTTDEIAAMHTAIRDFLIRQMPAFGDRIPVLYGGSVTVANAARFVEARQVDGLLVGGASLDAQKMTALCELVT